MPFLPKKKTAKKKRRFLPTSNFLDTGRWAHARRNQLNKNPICEVHAQVGFFIDCTSGGHIDHIIRRSAGGSELNPKNLLTLCFDCHTLKTTLESQKQIVKPAEKSSRGEYYPAPTAKKELIIFLSTKI